jgi:hypothetical protein
MQAEPTLYLSPGTNLSVYDDVTRGRHPLSHTIAELHTGINYSVRIQAYTRGSNHGYGEFNANYISMNSAVPSGLPPPVENFFAEETLKVIVTKNVAREVSEKQN